MQGTTLEWSSSVLNLKAHYWPHFLLLVLFFFKYPSGSQTFIYVITLTLKNNSMVTGDLLSFFQELIDDFIFPASNVYLQYMRNGELPAEQAIPVCSSPATINAGFELLVALAVGCVRNLKQIVDTLTEMYYIGTAITSM